MLAVGLVVFALVSASPIDPVQANVGQAAYVNMSEAKRAQLASYWGGDVPFWERFANWAGALLHGDMGTSLRFNAPVSEVIARRAANSLYVEALATYSDGDEFDRTASRGFIQLHSLPSQTWSKQQGPAYEHARAVKAGKVKLFVVAGTPVAEGVSASA